MPGLGWDVDMGAVTPEMGVKVCVRQEKEEVQGLNLVHSNTLIEHASKF